MTVFAIAHPWLTIIFATYLIVAALGWTFIIGAAIVSEDDD